MTDFANKFYGAIEPIVGAESFPATESASHPPLEERARLRINRRDIRRQRNIEAILHLAVSQSPDETSAQAAHPDWLVQFFDCAQDVTDEASQQFWARLLVTYIANPDSVFKRTLIQLHQMDQWELDAFIEYCSFAFAFESGWRFMFEEQLSRQEMWGYVRGNDYTQHFIHIGLLSPETAHLRATTAKGMRIRYFNKEYELADPPKLAGEDPLQVRSGFGYRKFTPVGQQLALTATAKTFYGYARNLLKALESERGVQFQEVEPTTGDELRRLPQARG